ncbi:MAG: Vgb family protein [Vulcanimicrobiaceae bacterium]
MSFHRFRTGSIGLASSLSLLALAACGKSATFSNSVPTPAPPVTPSVSAEFTIPTAGSQPTGITRGADGGLYFTEQAVSKIGKISTSGTVTEYPIPSASSAPTAPVGITSAPDNNLWFTNSATSTVGFMSTAGTFGATEYPTNTPNAKPGAITVGADGALWFVEPGANAIGRVTTSGVVTEYPITMTANAGPQSIVAGPDGNLWFTESSTTASKIGKMSYSGTELAEYPTPTPNAGPGQIIVGADGRLEFIETTAVKLGRMTTAGQLTEYPLPPATSAAGLVEGVDNNFYFSDPAQNTIAQAILGQTSVKEFNVTSANAKPGQMTIGPDDRIYFTEPGANKIGQFSYF